MVVAAKTVDPHPKLEGTIHATAKEGQFKLPIHCLSYDHIPDCSKDINVLVSILTVQM